MSEHRFNGSGGEDQEENGDTIFGNSSDVEGRFDRATVTPGADPILTRITRSLGKA